MCFLFAESLGFTFFRQSVFSFTGTGFYYITRWPLTFSADRVFQLPRCRIPTRKKGWRRSLFSPSFSSIFLFPRAVSRSRREGDFARCNKFWRNCHHHGGSLPQVCPAILSLTWRQCTNVCKLRICA